MPEYYDALETRDAAVREREQFARLSATIACAMSAPGWLKHLAGVDPKSVTSRAALAKLPVLHKSDISALQKQNPPFGGLNVTAPGKVRRLLMSPGPIFEPEGEGRTGTAQRALCSPQDFAPAISCTIPSPITSRLAGLFLNRGGARSAARSFPVVSAIPNSSFTPSPTTGPPVMSGLPIF